MSRSHSTRERCPEISLHLNADGTWPSQTVTNALLADVLKELRMLNELLHCHNTTGIPHTLKRIDRRLAKHAPLRKGTR